MILFFWLFPIVKRFVFFFSLNFILFSICSLFCFAYLMLTNWRQNFVQILSVLCASIHGGEISTTHVINAHWNHNRTKTMIEKYICGESTRVVTGENGLRWWLCNWMTNLNWNRDKRNFKREHFECISMRYAKHCFERYAHTHMCTHISFLSTSDRKTKNHFRLLFETEWHWADCSLSQKSSSLCASLLFVLLS